MRDVSEGEIMGKINNLPPTSTDLTPLAEGLEVCLVEKDNDS